VDSDADADKAAFLDDLRSHVGSTGTPRTSRDPVNLPTIRNWCDAMGEANPYFTDEDAAAASPHGGLIAPAATLNVWTMAGLHLGGPAPADPNEPRTAVYQKLNEAGFSSVVATNTELHFDRCLRPGDLLSDVTLLDEVSEQKTTRLGTGHFVTTKVQFTDQNDASVGSMLFRILKYTKPAPDHDAETGEPAAEAAPRKPKPRPRFNQDQAWFWEGLRQHELRIQRFTDDGSLVHPPANANPATQHMEYDWVVASGRGTLYSYTVAHHPQVPSFDYPHLVGIIELEEGVRIVSPIVGCTKAQLEIGMPLEVSFADTHDDVTLHQFQPAAPARAEASLHAGDVAEGDALPLCPIPLTPLLIVSTAIATRDFQEVHHDKAEAERRGSKDIFMNILTTNGIVARWIGDWAGNDVVFRNIKIGLGVPNYPGDIMTMSGSVTAVADDGTVTVGFIGRNSLGAHVTGTADVALPGSPAHAAMLEGGAR
jgi:uncharacterized OB-fold protein/acyl dehydratase